MNLVLVLVQMVEQTDNETDRQPLEHRSHWHQYAAERNYQQLNQLSEGCSNLR